MVEKKKKKKLIPLGVLVPGVCARDEIRETWNLIPLLKNKDSTCLAKDSKSLDSNFSNIFSKLLQASSSLIVSV
jgi:hypothetical protein